MVPSTRAKFTVQAVIESIAGDKKYGERIVLTPVYSSDPTSENRAFWTATPNGLVDMTINNPEAWGTFIVGREYFLDFTLAPQLVPA